MLILQHQAIAQQQIETVTLERRTEQFLVHCPSSKYVVWVGGKQNPYRCVIQDSTFAEIVHTTLLPTLGAMHGQRLLTTVEGDTLVLFFFSREFQKLTTQKLHIPSGKVVAGGEQFFGNKHLYAGCRILNNKMHLYYLPKDQNRLLVYRTADGVRYDFMEYQLQIPALYRRLNQTPGRRYHSGDFFFITQVRSPALDPIAALSLPVKWYAFEETLHITLDEVDAIHIQTIQEDKQEVGYERIPVRIKGYKPNAALYYHSLLLPNGQLFRLSRLGRQYYLHIAHDTTLLGAIPLFNSNLHPDSVAPVYTETLERSKERKTAEQMQRIRRIRRTLNDGTSLLRVDHTQIGDSVTLDIGALRFVEPVLPMSPRYNALDFFDYGYDPWQGHRIDGRNSNYYIYDYVKTIWYGQRWTIQTKPSTDIRERFLDALDWVKMEAMPLHYDWLEWNGSIYLLYLNKLGQVHRWKLN